MRKGNQRKRYTEGIQDSYVKRRQILMSNERTGTGGKKGRRNDFSKNS